MRAVESIAHLQLASSDPDHGLPACLRSFFFPLFCPAHVLWCGKWQHPARACERHRVKTEWLPVVKLAVAAPPAPVHEGVTCADAATSYSARFGWQLLLHFLSLCPPPSCLPSVDAFLWTAYRTCSAVYPTPSSWLGLVGPVWQCSAVQRRPSSSGNGVWGDHCDGTAANSCGHACDTVHHGKQNGKAHVRPGTGRQGKPPGR